MSSDDNSEVVFRNGVLRIVHSENRPSFEVEGVPRLAELIVSELGLTSGKTKTVDTPANRREGRTGHPLLVSPLLSGEDTKQYRSLTMRSAFLAMDGAGADL